MFECPFSIKQVPSNKGASEGRDEENKFDTNKDASNICVNERIVLNFLEFFLYFLVFQPCAPIC